MKLSTSKLAAAAPIAALACAASAAAAPLQSQPVAVRAKASVEAKPEAKADECTCTCAACQAKHGPKAAPAASASGAKAPVTIEIMQSSEGGEPVVIESIEVLDHVEIDTDRPEEVVVEEAIVVDLVEVNEELADAQAEIAIAVDAIATDDPEMAELAREVERILQTELEDITEEVIVESVVSAARAPGASVRVTPAPPAAQDDERGFLGVALEVSDDGVAIAEVMDGSPAEGAKFQAGDVLFAIGGRSITSMDELREALAGTKPGQSIVVSYMRDGRPRRARVDLAERESVVGPAVEARRAPTAAQDRPAAPPVEVEPREAAQPRVPAQRRRAVPTRPPAQGRQWGADVRPGARVRAGAESAAPGRDGGTRVDPSRWTVRLDSPSEGAEARRPAPGTDPFSAAQAENDVRVQAVMTGDDVRIVVLADGTVQVTGTNVRIDRRETDDTASRSSSNMISKLDMRIQAGRSGSLIDWVRGASGDRQRASDARGDRTRTRDARPEPTRTRDARPEPTRTRDARPEPTRTRDARPEPIRARDARPDRTRARDARPDRPDRPDARDARPDRAQRRTDRADAGDAEMAALRRRIREMSAEIDRLSRQIQRIGRALGDR